MPAAKPKTPKKSDRSVKNKPSPAKRRGAGKTVLPRELIVAIGCGAILGLSAPGLNQWYLSWFALVPLLLLSVSASGLGAAFVRGLCFGVAYNLVYMNWLLQLHPLDWMGYSPWESMAVAGAAWLIAAGHQGLIMAFLAVCIRAIPLTGGFLPAKVEGGWRDPALVVIPLLWVIIENKIGNAHDWLGVPWTMVEYSQYQILPVIQIASCVGGIGIGFLLLMSNCVLAGFIATFLGQVRLKALAYPTKTSAFAHLLCVGLCVLACVAFGYSRLPHLNGTRVGVPVNKASFEQHEGAYGDDCNDRSCPVSIIQGNINIEMQKNGNRKYTLADLTERYESLAKKVPAGLCIWTETALPTFLRDEKETAAQLSQLASVGKREMVVGSLDRDVDGHYYNAAIGIASNGKILDATYHKRYLVPFGEYMPSWVKYMPKWMQRLTSTPVGVGFTAGKFPVVLGFPEHVVAPLICFETVSPELVVNSICNGGDLLVNLSDLAWFHESVCGDQMIAFSVMRAVETGRDFVFAANTGPSAIIDRFGRVLAKSMAGKPKILTGQVTFHSDRTPFVGWFN